MWGGVRANYGVTDGKVAFQMKVFVLLILSVLEFFEHLGLNVLFPTQDILHKRIFMFCNIPTG